MATAPSPAAPRRKALRLNVRGIDYTIHFGDLTPVDAAAVRKATGFALGTLLDADPDIDTIAVLYWLARRKSGDRRISFEEAADAISYDAVLGGHVTITEVVDEEDQSDPEA